jgi:hypothetical protein
VRSVVCVCPYSLTASTTRRRLLRPVVNAVREKIEVRGMTGPSTKCLICKKESKKHWFDDKGYYCKPCGKTLYEKRLKKSGVNP